MTKAKAKAEAEAKAKAEAKGVERRDDQTESRGRGRGQAGGKSLAQLQAEAMADRRYTDLMSSGGVGIYRMSQEMLYFLPKGFVDVYAELFHKAFGGKDDGGVGARGASQAEQGQLDMGPKAARSKKRYKTYWVIADDHAVRVKDLVDRRLRALAREIRLELEVGEDSENGGGRGVKVHCDECGKILSSGWKFCPFDGREVPHNDGVER